MAEANIKAVITADDKASSVLNNFGDHVGSVGSKIAGVAEIAAKGLLVAGTAAVGFGALSVKAFSESQNLIAQTNAVLKSTGEIAGVTADQVTKLATSLEKQTKFSDEDVRSVENLLLTFTAINKDIFPQATKIVLDMATALGEDTKSASIQLGKALQDPILGVTALRRVGVNFNQAQQDVIKNLVDTGRSAEAQQLIMKELTKEFGGSAEAAGNTFAGALAKLKNQLNNVQESIGLVIVNGITPFLTKVAEFVSSIDWQAVIERSKAALKDLWENTLVPFGNTVIDIATRIFTFLKPSLEALWNTIETQVLPTLLRLWHEVVEPLAPVIGTILVGAIWLVINALNVFLAVVTPVLNFLLDHKWIVEAMAGAFLTLKAAMFFDGVVAGFSGAMAAAGGAMNAVRTGALASLNNYLFAFGGFAVIAAAAVAAAIVIVNAANQAKYAWDRAGDAATSAGNSMDDAIRKINASNLSPSEKAQRIRSMSGFAEGGSVAGNQAIVVGEKGAEVFVPQSAGTIIPNNQLSSVPAGGNQVINININAGAFTGSQVEARKFAKYIMDAFSDLAASKNQTAAQMLGVQ